jgi:predicted dithiol-disulfide oxidoreductase (DUF899 family)
MVRSRCSRYSRAAASSWPTEALLAGRWFGMQVCYLQHAGQVFETYWSRGRGAEAMATAYGLLDMTVYGRQEVWEDSPPGWPQPFETTGEQFRTNGRPSAQWSRLAAGHSDDLRTACVNNPSAMLT